MNEVGKILGLERLRGPEIPEVERELARTRFAAPGRRALDPVPVLSYVDIIDMQTGLQAKLPLPLQTMAIYRCRDKFKSPMSELSTLQSSSRFRILREWGAFPSVCPWEGRVSAGDPQRVWFPEMIQKMRAEWHLGMSFTDLIELRDSLDSILHEIRFTRGIHPPIFKCPRCGHIGPGGEPRVSVRAMILSLARFQIAEAERTRVLEREWAVYRKKKQLDLYGKAITSESRTNDCVHSNIR